MTSVGLMWILDFSRYNPLTELLVCNFRSVNKSHICFRKIFVKFFFFFLLASDVCLRESKIEFAKITSLSRIDLSYRMRNVNNHRSKGYFSEREARKCDRPHEERTMHFKRLNGRPMTKTEAMAVRRPEERKISLGAQKSNFHEYVVDELL